MTVSEKLISLREARGWSQADLAYHANVNPASLYFYEIGRNAPTLVVLQRITQALGVSLGVFDKCEAGADRRHSRQPRRA
jgi:transcriptional regulator with XRE-family HTH domain